MIAELKQKHDKLKEIMITGENYYNQENDVILVRRKLMGIKRKDGYAQVVDPYASNEKLPSGFVKTIVKQKVNYLINNNMTLTDQSVDMDDLFKNWKTDLKKLSTKVCYDIYGAWQIYLKDGKLKKKFISGKQLLPIYNEDNELTSVVRFYSKGSKDKAILYTNTTETHYILNKGKWETIETLPILRLKSKIGDDVVSEGYIELPSPPFAFLFNNDEWRNDIQPIKKNIDIYDKVDSDFANNIIDFQEIYHTLKNYQGQDLAEFNQQLKLFKTVPVGEDGDFATHMAEVPVVAKQTYLALKRKDIFENAMAVDLKEIAAGNATVVAIKAMFESLNMKAADFEQELQDFWKQFILLINFFNAQLGNDLVLDNEIIFDKAMLMNEKDLIDGRKVEVDTLTSLMGVIDDKSLLELASNLDFIKQNSDLDFEELLSRYEEKLAGIVIKEGE